MSDEDAQRREESEGDSACWFHLLCEECGAMNSGGAEVCWRCGKPLQ